MKKILVMSMMMFLSACACMNSAEEPEDEQVVFKSTRRTTTTRSARDCDFVENGVCYHYVYDDYYAPTTYRYSEPRRYETPCAAKKSYGCNKSADCGCNKQTVRETREPVEVVYRKTRYTTVYEPKTYEDVTYEKEPYVAPLHEGCKSCGM